ncbi:MAG: heme peroxidase family protein [Paracoccaceae bacterium]|nr:heme peroxidase family protein [Paracoccaceae bacterium]
MYCQPVHGGPTGPYSNVYQFSGDACHSFDYYFPDTDAQAKDPTRVAALDALGLAMIQQDPAKGANSTLPPVLTYFGQFIDHDITAGTDRDGAGEIIDDPDLAPRPRDEVRSEKRNMRSGRLDLDSLYGGLPDGVPQSPADKAFLDKLVEAMRSRTFPGQMRIAFYDNDGEDIGVPLPTDRAGDVLRLGALIKSGLVTEAEIQGLSDGMRKMFTIDDDTTPNPTRAIIGDARNDENLIVAQFHLVFLRLHNRLVQRRPGHVSKSEAFEWARQRTRWIYQWLVINDYLRRLCPHQALDDILAAGPGLYENFRNSSGCIDEKLPLPLEFSAAAFRFGHSMVRDAYDWNTFFGTETTHPQILPLAGFDLLFAFTGSGELGRRGTDQLPANWGADWERMVFAGDGAPPTEFARKIDTHLALELGSLPDGMAGTIMAHLAQRNLRRGHLLNLPSAQSCAHELGITPLSGAELGGGDLGQVLADGDLIDHTPLWYYVLREAEVTRDGQGLGPLGTQLVAQTLLGLVVSDPASYWHQTDTAGDRWSPADLMADGLPDLSSLEAVMRFTGQLD